MDVPLTFLITGAGRGLGFALAAEVVARGHRVIGTLRDPNCGSELLALAERCPDRARVFSLDVADEGACWQLGETLAHLTERVDVLVNNAGINSSSPEVEDARTANELGSLTTAALERLIRTNALGAILVTRAVAPLLSRGTRSHVVNMSSRRGSLAEKTSGGNYGYCISKAALNMATRALAADLAPRGVIVVAVHPGSVRTAMAQSDATLSPPEAARLLLDLTARLGPAHAGRFLNTDGTDHPW